MLSLLIGAIALCFLPWLGLTFSWYDIISYALKSHLCDTSNSSELTFTWTYLYCILIDSELHINKSYEQLYSLLACTALCVNKYPALDVPHPPPTHATGSSAGWDPSAVEPVRGQRTLPALLTLGSTACWLGGGSIVHVASLIPYRIIIKCSAGITGCYATMIRFHASTFEIP